MQGKSSLDFYFMHEDALLFYWHFLIFIYEMLHFLEFKLE